MLPACGRSLPLTKPVPHVYPHLHGLCGSLGGGDFRGPDLWPAQASVAGESLGCIPDSGYTGLRWRRKSVHAPGRERASGAGRRFPGRSLRVLGGLRRGLRGWFIRMVRAPGGKRHLNAVKSSQAPRPDSGGTPSQGGQGRASRAYRTPPPLLGVSPGHARARPQAAEPGSPLNHRAAFPEENRRSPKAALLRRRFSALCCSPTSTPQSGSDSKRRRKGPAFPCSL